MNHILLATVQKSHTSDTLVWVLFGVAIVLLVWLLVFQRRKGSKLHRELEQLSKMKENNIEAVFVHKAMKLSTWHMDAKTMSLTYDSDFRDKSGWVAPYVDGDRAANTVLRLDPRDMEHVMKALSDLCEGRTEEYHTEYRVLIPNTDRFYWEESFATILERDVEGKPTSIVGTTMRIDERKHMEEALIEARNRAEESDRLKSAFIANMSHEIRTPLNAIVGFTSVLPDVTEAEERQGLLELVHENTQKLLCIIDDVVNISKIESGKEELVLSNFELNQLLADLAERYRTDLKPGVDVTTMFGSSQLFITSDHNRLSEIVKHLLSNAVKFTMKGNIVVGYDNPVDGRICLWVQDTGKGIAVEHQERIFERFFKVDEFVPGAGLGLSICRTMAYSLGGTVNVDSKLGESSKFTVEIPIQ